MQTRDALRRMSGKSTNWGDGPLGAVAQQLVASFNAREAQRMERAEVAADLSGKGPILQALMRRFAEAEGNSLDNVRLPMAMRFDAYDVLQKASAENPKDRGLKQASAFARRLWEAEPEGVLMVGDVARMRTSLAAAFPKSALTHVLDVELPKVGFNTLPVQKLAKLAGLVDGHDEASIQASADSIIRTHGLDGQKPNQIRARAFFYSLVGLGHETSDASAAAYGGQAALSRLAQFEDEPMLEEPMDALPGEHEMEVPHEEESEVISEIDSPITGEPLALELGVSDGSSEEFADVVDEDVMMGPEEVEGLEHFGQLEDFGGDLGEEPEGISPVDEGSGSSTTLIEDPSAPGEMLEVEMRPVVEESDEISEATMPLPGQLTARRFDVYAVRGGVVERKPIDQIRASTMPRALRQIAANVGEGNFEVKASRDSFGKRSVIVLDADAGNHLLVVAKLDPGEEFDENYPGEDEVPVDSLRSLKRDEELYGVDPAESAFGEDGGYSVKTELEDAYENLRDASDKVKGVDMEPAISGQPGDEVPAMVSNDGGDTLTKNKGKKARVLTVAQVRAVCAALGLTAEQIEARLLDGQSVGTRGWSIRIAEDGNNVELMKDGRGRTAGIEHLDLVIADFMAVVASAAAPAPQAKKAARKPVYEARPLFLVGCVKCGSMDEYVMPDEAVDVTCGSCSYVTKSAAVAQQLNARQASAFPGYVVVTEVPAKVAADVPANVKRILGAVKSVVPSAMGALRPDNKLEIALRPAGEAEINRVRRVLEDRFGIADMMTRSALTNQDAGPQPPQTNQPMPTNPTVQPPAVGGDTNIEVAPGVGPAGQNAPAGPPGTPPVGQKAARLWRVAYRETNGKSKLAEVEGANEAIVRRIFASYEPDAKILSVTAQVEMALDPMDPADMPALPADDTLPPDELGGEPMGSPLGDGGMPVMPSSSTAVRAEVVEAIGAAMLTLRNSGVDIATAVKDFQTQFKKLLERFGDETSPARAALGAEIIRAAQESWAKPALLELTAAYPDGMSQHDHDREMGGYDLDPEQEYERKIQELFEEEFPPETGPHAEHEARRQRAQKVLEPGKPKVQQPPRVSVPKNVLGPDSSQGHGNVGPKGKPKSQVVMQGTHPPTDMGGGEENKEHKVMNPKKPPSGGSYGLVGDGTSLTPTDLGSDSSTGDNKTTKSWDGVSKKAPKSIRSAAIAALARIDRRAGLGFLATRHASAAHLAQAVEEAKQGYWPEDALWNAREATLDDGAGIDVVPGLAGPAKTAWETALKVLG